MARELVSVSADEAGRDSDVVVRVVLLTVVEVVKTDSPGPTPIADERRSSKNAIAAWSEIFGVSSPDRVKLKLGLTESHVGCFKDVDTPSAMFA